MPNWRRNGPSNSAIQFFSYSSAMLEGYVRKLCLSYSETSDAEFPWMGGMPNWRRNGPCLDVAALPKCSFNCGNLGFCVGFGIVFFECSFNFGNLGRFGVVGLREFPSALGRD